MKLYEMMHIFVKNYAWNYTHDLLTSIRGKSYLIAFITKEMNFPVPIIFNMSQAIRFVPAFWEDIKTYLTSYAYMQSIISKFFSQSGHKLISNFVNLWKTTDHKPGNKIPKLISTPVNRTRMIEISSLN